MNERFKELLGQAEEFSLYMNDTSYNNLHQIFAELIVKECARISEDDDMTMTGQGSSGADAMKKHFGIE
jgi:hypothetical protein